MENQSGREKSERCLKIAEVLDALDLSKLAVKQLTLRRKTG